VKDEERERETSQPPYAAAIIHPTTGVFAAPIPGYISFTT